MCGMEFEWFNFAETPQSWAAKKGVGPEPITPGMFGYSLLRANASRPFFEALFNEMGAFGIPIEGLHTETGPGVYEAAILFSEALEAGGPRDPLQDRRQGDRLALRHHAELHGEVERAVSRAARGTSTSRCPTARRTCSTTPRAAHGMSKLFESYLAGQVAAAHAVRADVLADDQQLQATGRRLLGAGEADVGRRQPHGELSRDSGLAQVHAPRNALPGRRRQSVSRDGRRDRRGLHGVEKNLKLTAKPITGTNQGAENIPRAPRTLIETTRIFRRSDVARDWFGDDFVDHFAATREWEWRQWQDGVTDWELKRYFEII